MTFETLVSKTPEKRENLARITKQVNDDGGTYHRLNFGEDMVMEGDYDMFEYIKHYNIPESLVGKKVLDIGTAAGFFSLESLRRGGIVTAIDILESPLLEYIIPNLNVDLRYIKKNIYDLDSSFGQFDLVICGSLLLHLPEPFSAIQRISSICRGQVILASSCTSDSQNNSTPICEFIGEKSKDGAYWTYWNLSAEALKRMLFAAGFTQIKNIEHFTLKTDTKRINFETPHVVMSAFKC